MNPTTFNWDYCQNILINQSAYNARFCRERERERESKD
jgi:hypothetical protein